jgi:hypothetical protein
MEGVDMEWMIHRIPNGDEMTLSELIEILGKR